MTSYLINESLMQATGHHVLNGVCPNLTTALKSGLRSGPKEDLSDPTNESSKMGPSDQSQAWKLSTQILLGQEKWNRTDLGRMQKYSGSEKRLSNITLGLILDTALKLYCSQLNL